MSDNSEREPATVELGDEELEDVSGAGAAAGGQSAGTTAGKATFTGFTITKKVDTASPGL